VLSAEAPPQSRVRFVRRRLAGLGWHYTPSVVLVLAAIGIWEGLIRLLNVPAYLWPAPSTIVRSMRDDAGLLAAATWVTAQEVVYGFAIAIVAALSIGIALHLSPALRRAIYPILIASQSVPTVVLAPVLVIVMGFNIGPKLAIIALFTFFPIVVNTVDGLGSVDRDYIRMMLTLDASRWSIFRRVEFPAALPLIFSGARIGATYAAIGAIFGEWAGSDSGLGFEMLQAQGRLETPRVFAAVLIVTALAITLFTLVTLVERTTIPWARAGRVSSKSQERPSAGRGSN
jgi:putative hydroxymethylpyrimidine transport system permease protein